MAAALLARPAPPDSAEAHKVSVETIRGVRDQLDAIRESIWMPLPFSGDSESRCKTGPGLAPWTHSPLSPRTRERWGAPGECGQRDLSPVRVPNIRGICAPV